MFLKIVGSPEVVAGIQTDTSNGVFLQVDPGGPPNLDRLRSVLSLPLGTDMAQYAVHAARNGEQQERLDTASPVPGDLKELWIAVLPSAQQREEVASPITSSTYPSSVASPVVPEAPVVKYAAEGGGWLPVRKRVGAGAPSYHIAVTAPDYGGGATHSLCGKCIRNVLSQVESEVVWADVGPHPAPVEPNNAFMEAGVDGKLSFKRNENGEWKVKRLHAKWEKRLFRANARGLHYYNPSAFVGVETKMKPKNSKLFTAKTVLIQDPSPAEFGALKNLPPADAAKHYFGLLFKDPEEALLIRVIDPREKDKWTAFLSSALKHLTLDEAWAAASHPVENKLASSNVLVSIAKLKQIEREALEAAEADKREVDILERKAASAKAEAEHLLRAVDKAEGEVAKKMSRIRDLKKTLLAEEKEETKYRDDAIRELAAAKRSLHNSKSSLDDMESTIGNRDRRIDEVQRELHRLKAERDAAVAARQRVFARWRKMEERPKKQPPTAPPETGLLAFSPVDSPCHPLRIAEESPPALGYSRTDMLIRAASASASPARQSYSLPLPLT
ncbi:hypothetical protein DIPPA_14835 [Diplonema papillatum]|nr:hypothetical protein DIPPA_14835 [Diplonema papillatum]